MTVRFASSAEADLVDLWLVIAEDNQMAADKVVDSIYATATLIGTQPEMGRARPELADGLHSFPTKTPYIIFYLPDADGIVVIRVLHHARDIDSDYFDGRSG
jgi:plasmid stabilization system protein ParE